MHSHFLLDLFHFFTVQPTRIYRDGHTKLALMFSVSLDDAAIHGQLRAVRPLECVSTIFNPHRVTSRPIDLSSFFCVLLLVLACYGPVKELI